MPLVTRLLVASLLAAFTQIAAATPRLELALERKYYVEGQQNNFYLKTTIHTGGLAGESSPPASNIVFLVDRSGSMEGEKLAALKTSLQDAFAKFSSHDRVALVAFGSSVETLIPPTQVDQLGNASAAIANISTDGGSALYEGLQRAHEEILKNAADHTSNRIFLIADGPPNKGIIDSKQITTLADSISRQDITITSFALGPEAPTELLSQIANNSSTHSVPKPAHLAETIAYELQPLNPPLAQNAILEIEFHRSIDITESIGREADLTSRRAIFQLGPLRSHQEITTLVQGTLNASATFFSPIAIAKVKLSYTPVGLPPTSIESEIRARFTPNVSHSFDTVQAHVYQTICEYETSDIVREAIAYQQEGKTKKALRNLRRLARNIRNVSEDIPDLQTQASLDQINRTIDAIENANESPIEQQALTETLYPTASPQAAETSP